MATDVIRGFEFDRKWTFRDSAGNPAQVEGTPVHSSSDPAVVNVISPPVHPDSPYLGDPFAATYQAIGAVGATAAVSIEGDADLGAGVVPVIGSDDINVTSGAATSANFEDSPHRQTEL